MLDKTSHLFIVFANWFAKNMIHLFHWNYPSQLISFTPLTTAIIMNLSNVSPNIWPPKIIQLENFILFTNSLLLLFDLLYPMNLAMNEPENTKYKIKTLTRRVYDKYIHSLYRKYIYRVFVYKIKLNRKLYKSQQQ